MWFLLVAVLTWPVLALSVSVPVSVSFAQSSPPSLRTNLLLDGIDKDLRVLDRAQLSSDERKQRDEAKSLAKAARALLRDARADAQANALAKATAASSAIAVLVRRELRLDVLLAASEKYRTRSAPAAVQALADSLASDLAAPVRYLEDNRDRWGVEGTPLADVGDRTLASLCLLETEVAFLDGYDAEVRLRFASRLLAAANPAALPTRFAERWYVAVAGHLQGYFLPAQAMLHVQRAMQRFPDDAGMALVAGMFFEFAASPGVELPAGTAPRLRAEATIARSSAGQAVNRDVVSQTADSDAAFEQLAEAKRTGLARAEEFYRKALAADAGNEEARLRLGRILFLTGRSEAALAELRAAAASSSRRVRYLAALFEGAVHEAADRQDEAIASYEAAAKVCPTCLSAGMALSQAQRAKGMVETADATLDLALARDANASFADFWWDYLVGAYSQRDQLMRELRGGVR